MTYEQMKPEERHLYGNAIDRQPEFWLLRLPNTARRAHIAHCTTQWNGEERGYERL